MARIRLNLTPGECEVARDALRSSGDRMRGSIRARMRSVAARLSTASKTTTSAGKCEVVLKDREVLLLRAVLEQVPEQSRLHHGLARKIAAQYRLWRGKGPSSGSARRAMRNSAASARSRRARHVQGTGH